MSRVEKRKKKGTHQKPISLSDVDFKKLMGAFLIVKPDEKKRAKKKTRK